jgi:hypothetical protein
VETSSHYVEIVLIHPNFWFVPRYCPFCKTRRLGFNSMRHNCIHCICTRNSSKTIKNPSISVPSSMNIIGKHGIPSVAAVEEIVAYRHSKAALTISKTKSNIFRSRAMMDQTKSHSRSPCVVTTSLAQVLQTPRTTTKIQSQSSFGGISYHCLLVDKIISRELTRHTHCTHRHVN